jgi:hypothetical protein
MKLLSLLFVIVVASTATLAADITAEQLVAKVVNARKTSGFRIRARLIMTTPGSDKRDARQLLIKGRTDGGPTKILYQVLWPEADKGRALFIERSADHKTSGFLFEPADKVISLTPELMARPFLGSDLSIEDLAEDFWNWPSQKIVGEEIVDQHPCQIIESRPPPDATTSYSLIKTWVSPQMALPLRIHEFDKDGKLVKRFNVEKIIKQSTNYWAPATVVIEPADGHHRTTLDGSKGERDLDVPAEDFTLEKIKSLQ